MANIKTKEQPSIIFYSVGIVCMSACVSNDTTIEELEKQANSEYSTGIKSKWKLSKDKTFADGGTNPC